MEWNRTVDRALVSGVSEAAVVELKKTEIMDKVKESVEQNGNKPELFGEIVRAAVALLEKLIAKVMRKVRDIAEKVIGKAIDAVKETPKETKRPSQQKPSVLASKYPRLKEIDRRLKDQNKAIFEREKKRDELKKELSECTGIFKGGRRKELQQEIDSINDHISNMRKRFSAIVREYKFDSVQAFYKELKAARREYLDYQAERSKYEKTYGEKAADSMSVRDRLRQKEQMLKERETVRVHQARQKDKGAR